MSQPTQDIHPLLRFLTQSVKVPLSQALQLIKPLHAAHETPQSLARTKSADIQKLLGTLDPDGKLSERIIRTATKTSKRKHTDADTANSDSQENKRTRTNPKKDEAVPLPAADRDEDRIRQKIVYTNRAPLLLAFAVVLLRYTHPGQPEDSRLSVGMGAVSAGARAKAVDLGIRAPMAEVEVGRKMRVLGRDVELVRREKVGAGEGDGEESGKSEEKLKHDRGGVEDEETVKETQIGGGEKEPQSSMETVQMEDEDWFWGLNTEAMADEKRADPLPIHSPASAYNYLMQAFVSAPSAETPNNTTSDAQKTQAQSTTENIPASAQPKSKSKGPAKTKARLEREEKEKNLGLVLGAVDLLYKSWAETLGKQELDRRAWNWYVKVRPAIEDGKKGWGAKGVVKLGDILDLRR